MCVKGVDVMTYIFLGVWSFQPKFDKNIIIYFKTCSYKFKEIFQQNNAALQVNKIKREKGQKKTELVHY